MPHSSGFWKAIILCSNLFFHMDVLKPEQSGLDHFVGFIQFRASWITTFNPRSPRYCWHYYRFWSDFWPLRWLGSSYGTFLPGSPSLQSVSAQTRGSPLSGHGRVTVWRQGAAGRMLLLPVMCPVLGGRNRTTDGRKGKGFSERGLSPWAPKMARLADYYLVVGYDLDKRGGCLS